MKTIEQREPATETGWICLYRDQPYDKAMLKARKEMSDDAKLRKMGSRGNYADVHIHMSSHLLGRKLYDVYALLIGDQSP